MTFVYLDGMTVPDALKQWASGDVEWRNGRHFEAPESRARLVYTDIEEVAEAYRGQGVEVRPIPEPEVEATNAAEEVAEDHGIGLATVKGTGKDGRVLKSDVTALIE